MEKIKPEELAVEAGKAAQDFMKKNPVAGGIDIQNMVFNAAAAMFATGVRWKEENGSDKK